MILVYSTFIYTSKYKQLNYTKFAGNNSTAVHILRYEGKDSIFSENNETRLNICKKGRKRAKIHKTIQKRKYLTIFGKDTLTHGTIACMKDLKYDLHCLKCISFNKIPYFFYFYQYYVFLITFSLFRSLFQSLRICLFIFCTQNSSFSW